MKGAIGAGLAPRVRFWVWDVGLGAERPPGPRWALGGGWGNSRVRVGAGQVCAHSPALHPVRAKPQHRDGCRKSLSRAGSEGT